MRRTHHVQTAHRGIRLRRLLTSLAAALALAAPLAACTGDEPTPAGDAGGGPSATAAGSGEPATGPDADLPPLDAFLGAGGGPDGDSGVVDNRDIEEVVASCMAEQGFEYVPDVLSWTAEGSAAGPELVDLSGGGEGSDLPPDEFARRFGYGFSTSPPGADTGDEDPNADLVSAMGVAERVAYHRALMGDEQTLDDQGYPAGSEFVTTDDSCSGRAYSAAPSDAEVDARERRVARVQEAYRSLVDRISDLRTRELEEPRVLAADRAYSGCLAAEGFPGMTGLEAPRTRALELARDLLGQDLDRTDVDPAALEELRSTEIRLAVAELTCRKPWEATFAVVRDEVERAFVEENLEELEAYRSALAAAER
jgi:hypothetical protein